MNRYSLTLLAGILACIPAQFSSGQIVDAPLPEPEILLPLDPVTPMGPSETAIALPEAVAAGPAKVDSGAPVEIVQERYPSGKVKIRREMTLDQHGNYIRHGEWNMWDEAGNLIATGQYRNDQRQGAWTRVHTGSDAELFSEMPYKQFRGPFTSQATFENGRLHGKWIILDSEQRKISEWEYTNGVLHGLSIWNYASGSPMREATFLDGLVDGYLRQYDPNGKLVIDETYQQGRKLAPKIDYDKAGKKISEGIYLHARFVIESPDDWWSAKPVKYVAVGQDARHGCWTSWYPGGQKRAEGIYEHDLPEGEFTWWHSNGQQAVVGNHRKGKPHGAWVWWHENGQKATTGQYVDGEPSGAWIYWNADGQLAEKSDFSTAAESVVLNSSETPEKAVEAAPQTQESPSRISRIPAKKPRSR